MRTWIGTVVQIKERLEELEREVGTTAPESKEITLLADKTIPFKVLKKIMSTCHGFWIRKDFPCRRSEGRKNLVGLPWGLP